MSNMETMYWTIDSVLEALEKYKEIPELWNPQHPDYRNKGKKMDGWMRMARELGVDQIKLEKRLKNCVFQYRRERKKLEALRKAGGVDVRSGWFAYEAMEFLANVTPCAKSPPASALAAAAAAAASKATSVTAVEHPVKIKPEPNWPETRRASVSATPCKVEIVQSKSALDNIPELQDSVDSNSEGARVPSTSKRKKPRVEGKEDSPDSAASRAQALEECNVFGELVAYKLKNIEDPRRRLIVQHKINTLLLQEQLNQTPDTTTCTILFQPGRRNF